MFIYYKFLIIFDFFWDRQKHPVKYLKNLRTIMIIPLKFIFGGIYKRIVKSWEGFEN